MIVLAVLFAAFLAWIALHERTHVDDAEDERVCENLRRQRIHAQAGNLMYPHELADGTVRWYNIGHDTVAL